MACGPCNLRNAYLRNYINSNLDKPLMMTVIFYHSRDFDCSAIAKSFGGGGHTKAAGFQSNTMEVWKI